MNNTVNSPVEKSYTSAEDLNVRLVFFRLIPFWPLFVSTMVLSLGSAFLINRYTVPTYLVKGTFLIQEEETAGNVLLEELGADLIPNPNIQNEIGIISS